ncbi:putative NUDIX family NTP pyrophosphohydrolase [Rhizobium sp. ERR 922]|uniref:NUDIX hydrolase n=1 Tax=unclassified Rhizobium TaxID=2613769 RepID=UPI0011A6ECB6|nr:MULTISPECIES: NUDIX hydrolase [unclassified Rhizobium]TWB44075.1 putative NUDIX family NTP pyrophosphohydrolase [Rhizobium sp. ERR 922]TWB87852.1 putative NUDIX family NTP pyrophosphohydrolase [Rhizobium sp. ERR 942]
MLSSAQRYASNVSAARDVPQAGAICYRRGDDGGLEVLLVGSRRNGRWGIPKGHIDPGETSEITAARESFEEAGVVGRVEVEIFGIFTYEKDSTPDRYHVSVHLAEVTRIAMDYPEKSTRKKAWFPLAAAPVEVSQPGLRELLRKFADGIGDSGTTDGPAFQLGRDFRV